MSKNRIIQFKNCQLIRSDGIEFNVDLWVKGNKISNKLEHADIKIDCKKLFISPGYIDLQLNGKFCHEFFFFFFDLTEQIY